MVQLLHAAPAQPQRREPNLILHCGAHAVALDDVALVTTPRATATWTPMPHHQLIQTVQRTLATTNAIERRSFLPWKVLHRTTRSRGGDGLPPQDETTGDDVTILVPGYTFYILPYSLFE